MIRGGPLPRPARALVRAAGLALVALSLAFVAAQLVAHEPWRLDPRLLRALLAWSALGAVVYALAGLLLSAAWRLLLAEGGRGLSPAVTHAVYGRSQIAKYLPSNVLHVAGRHIMGRALGIGHGHLIRAALLETGGLALCGGLLALPLLLPITASAPPLVLVVGAVTLTFATAAAAACVRPMVPLRRLPEFGAAWLLYLAFFVVCGAILWLLTVAAGGAGTAPGLAGLARCVSINALAWLAGFVAVGAAAGAGVREAVLIACLADLLGAPEAAAVALALRVVSTAGDALFFLVGLALPGPLAARRSA